MNAKLSLCAIACVLYSGSSFAGVTAQGDTLYIPGGTMSGRENAGSLESTINGDTLANGARKNPNRVYALNQGQYYLQLAPIHCYNPTGTLTICGIPSTYGKTKPIILITPVPPDTTEGTNTVYGSIRCDGIHYQTMQSGGRVNNELFYCGTANQLPQSLTINNCLFEFCNIDLFDCTNESGAIGGWPYGAKFRITNSYFRNMFYPAQWWGSRILQCKHPIDTLWMENCTVTSAGMTILQQNQLTDFAYFNHNTFVNNKKNWLTSPYYRALIIANNIFINQNWVGEDTNTVSTYNGDPAHNYSANVSSINIDSVKFPGSYITVQPQYQVIPFTGQYTSDLDAVKMRVFVSNNISYNDTLMNRYYFNENNAYNSIGPYPVSYLTWLGFGSPPWVVHNVPAAWMNKRTKSLFAAFPRTMIEENTITANPQTVTPGIKDATVADQMAKWNSYQWGDPNYPASANDITHSGYIFGDYDPATLPGVVNGVKTENAGDHAGIVHFTDLTEKFSQSAHLSSLDNLPIGALIWDDEWNASYNPADDFQKVDARYKALGGPGITGIKGTPGIANVFSLSQNYPNPFNPTTTIRYSIPARSRVALAVFNTLGQIVADLVHGTVDAGDHEVTFDGTRLASGVYFYRLQAGSLVQTRKFLLLR